MPNFYSTLRRLALTALLGGGGVLAAQAQTLGQTLAGASTVAGTYTDLGTAGTVITTANTDDANSAAQNIGFSFGFAGSIFTQFVFNTNGVIRLGSAAPSTAALYLDTNNGATSTDPLQSTSTADVNLLMPFNYDLVSGTGGAEYRVATTGNVGARVCTIQWKNVADKTGPSTPQQYANFSFQLKLYEAGGNIEFVYGTATASALATTSRDGDIGLKAGGIGNNQLLLASKLPATAWSATTFRTSNYSAANTHNIDKSVLPDAGRIYRFTNPSYCVPGAVAAYPYTETFDGVTAPALPCGVTVFDANNDGSTWANYNSSTYANTTPNSMRYSYSSTAAANDWFFTNGLAMTVGKSYQLQFKYRNYSTTYTQGLEVKVGNAATPAGQTSTVFSNTGITSTTYATTTAGSALGQTQVVLFTPTTANTYYFGFHAISQAGQFYLYVDDVVVTEVTAPACPQPAALVVSGVTTVGATVAFTGPTNGTAYTVLYGPKGFNPATGGTPVQTTTSPITLSGLSSNTNYDVYVQATCGTTGTSVQTGPVSFLTACATTTNYPYTETFDGVTAPALPCGVTVLDANGDGSTWANYNSSTYANTTPNSMRYNYSSTNAADDWFFTNALNMTVGKSYQLQFKYRSYGSTYNQNMEVKVGTAATAAGQTTTVFSASNFINTAYATTAAGGAPGQVVLFTPTANGVYYFGFHATSAAGKYYINVDDVVVTEVTAPACPQPVSLAISNLTATGATVTFSGPTNGTAYTVLYGPKGFNPATGGTPVQTSSLSATLSNLSSNTNYDVYVQTTCGTTGTSVQTGPISFLTACATVTAFPYLENFDGVTAPALPCGVTVVDSNNDGKTWVNTNSTTYANSAPNCMQYSYNSASAANDWFFTAALQLQAGATYQLQFKYRSYSATWPEGLEVKAGTTATAAGQTTLLFSNTNITNATYATTTAGTGAGQVASFTPATGGIYYFGFHAISAADEFYLMVDDVRVDIISLASCPTPTNLSVNSITDTRATVNFTGPSTSSSYKVYYVPANGTLNTQTSPFASGPTSPVTITTGLSPNTSYDAYVEATCGSNGASLIAGPVRFTTACATTMTFPYSQNFDGVTAPALPCGVTVFDANSDGFTWVNNNETPNSSPNSMRYSPNPVSAADDWFFTNAMSLQAGVSYQLQFKHRVYSPNYPERLEVKIGTATTAAGQTTTLFSNLTINNNTYITTTSGTGTGQVAVFTPTTTGIYFIGFHAISKANSFYLYVDDVTMNITTPTATKSSVAPGFRAEASPVPFGERLNLSLTTLVSGPLEITLHDALGRVVRETKTTVPAGASSLEIPNAGTLPGGMYILTVRQGGNTQVIRVAHE